MRSARSNPAPDCVAATRRSWIVPLAEATDLRESGGKASNLARLMACGAPVPDGFVITDTALRLVIESANVTAADTADLMAALFRGEPVPDALGAELDHAWAGLSAAVAIVRSSAVGEDSDAASFAGQLDSIVDVSNAAMLRQALACVWASRWAPRSLAYQAARHVPLVGMGVIVQRQIPAVLSGVLFTVAPRAACQMLLEYCGGMGEALVSGAVNPGRVTIARRTFRWVKQASPDSPAAMEAALLNDVQITSLGRQALEIERVFGGPQDLEWAMDANGRVWIVQARPITVRSQATEGRPQAAIGVLWSNANVNENFPQPICPLLYSIASAGYYHYFRNLAHAFGLSARRRAQMDVPMRQIIGVHGARLYYNLTSIHGVLRSAPFGELLTTSFNQFVGAEASDPATTGESFAGNRRGRAGQLGELAIIATHTLWQYLFVTRRVERFERTVSTFADRTHPDRLAARALPELLDDFRGFLDIRCHRWNDAALADAGAMVCYGLLQRLLSRACPGEDQQALHNNLLKALPDLVSSMPPLKLWELSREVRSDARLAMVFTTSTASDALATIAHDERFAPFHARLSAYLDEWGFRCSAELMLTVPSFQEVPEPVIELLKAYAAMDGESPANLLKRQEAERLAETARVLRRLRWRPMSRVLPFVSQALVVSTLLNWTQRCIQLRERARLKQALLYSRLRRIALALGERLIESGRIDGAEDIFFLSADEIDALAAGSAMFPDHVRPLVAMRRQAHGELSAMTPPDSMRLAAGEYWPATGFSPVDALDPMRPATRLHGVGACGGSVTGRATVLTDVTQSHRLATGDVLVTRQTDPGWAPVFPLIAGLVIERGGMLSHGAIIAREFGIPSVVGVKDATRHIPPGGRITVDGDRGLVHMAEERA